MRYAARVDANQAAIVKALRDAGAYVFIIGLPVDLLLGKDNKTWLVEIKRDSKARYTAIQRDFFMKWTGASVVRVESVEQALALLDK